MDILSAFGGRDHEIPLALGSIYGLRAFAIDGDHLTGPSYSMWRYHSGENEAGCVSFAYLTGLTDLGISRLPKDHTARKTCDCGFYAYTDGRNAYYNPTRIAAVVQSYGRVTYGAYGYRSQKLKIVAAVNPYLKDSFGDVPDFPDWYVDVGNRGDRHPWTIREKIGRACSRVYWLWYLLLVFYLSGTTLWIITGSRFSTVMWSLYSLGAGWLVYQAWRWTRKERRWEADVQQSEDFDKSDEMELFKSKQWLDLRTDVSPKTFKKLAERYPEIEWFSSSRAMIEKYPLTRYADMPKRGTKTIG